MPRGALSRADAALIEALADGGQSVSPYQLERWRKAGLLPRPVRKGLGRGAGSVSTYPEEALATARVLAVLAGQGRSVHLAALGLYVADLPVEESALRAALCWFLERRHQLLKRGAERYGDVGEVAARVARKVSIYDPEVVASYFPDGLGLGKPLNRAEQRRRAQRRRDIRDAFFTATLAAIDPKEATDLEQFEFMAAIGWDNQAEELTAEMYRAAKAGQVFGTDDPNFSEFPTLSDVAGRASVQQLGEARDIVRACGAVNMLLYLAAVVDYPAWELFSSLRNEPRWALARTFEFTTAHHPDGIVLSVLSLISCDEMGDDLLTLAAALEYATTLLPDALRGYVRMRRAIDAEFDLEVPGTKQGLALMEELADDISSSETSDDRNFLTGVAVGFAEALRLEMEANFADWPRSLERDMA